MFLKNKTIIFKIRRSKVTDYAALMNRNKIRKEIKTRAKHMFDCQWHELNVINMCTIKSRLWNIMLQ